MNGLQIILLSLLLSYADCTVKVTGSGQTIFMSSQSAVTFKCKVTGNDTFDRWSNPLVAIPIHNSSEFELDRRGDEHRLKILQPKVQFAGNWTCYSKEGNSDFLKAHFYPGKSPAEKQQTLIKGSLGMIEVDIFAFPRPVFTWEKDGNDLTITDRYSVATNGSLLISNVRRSDAGTYSVSGALGVHSAEIYGIEVTVLERPTINSSSLNENRTLGGNITFTCNATGVPKPSIVWKKDSKIVADGGRFTISKSTLLIVNITPSDVGKYTCEASNSVGAAKLTSSLVFVSVPPKLMPLSDKEVRKGETLSVTCNATGNPSPNVQWFKNGIVVPASQQVKSPGQSLLKIPNIQLNQGGVYECSAQNDAVDEMGNPIIQSQAINVKVFYPPKFAEVEKTVYIGLNRSFEINCSASGFPRPDVKLIHMNKDLSGDITNTLEQTFFSFSKVRANKEDLGRYVCRASNKLEKIEQTIEVTVKLDKPRIYNVTTTCQNVSFMWHPDAKDNIKINSYLVTIKRGNEIKEEKILGGNILQVTFVGLVENATYEISVKQKTDVSNIGHNASQEIQTKCPLAKITRIERGQNLVKVYWPEIRKKIDNFILKYRIRESSERWKKLNTTEILIEVPGLSPGTYVVVVFYEIAGSETQYTMAEEFVIPSAKRNEKIKTSTTHPPKEETSTSTKSKEPLEPVARKKGLSGGAVAAIVIVIILLVLIAVDIFCCFFNQCGVVHMCAATCSGRGRDKYNVDGAPEEGTKLKEIDEDGKKDPEA